MKRENKQAQPPFPLARGGGHVEFNSIIIACLKFVVAFAFALAGGVRGSFLLIRARWHTKISCGVRVRASPLWAPTLVAYTLLLYNAPFE